MSNWYRSRGKRILDVCLTLAVMPLALPLMLSVAVLVRVGLGRPVFFRQQRIGHDERPFTLLKFRTMRDLRDATGALAPDRDRMTGLGGWLRRTSLDELPELLNVLRGEMSLVGPRPLLPSYLARYSKRQSRRHEVRPGLTGLAQIRGRNLTSWSNRLESDVEYAEQVSVRLDLSILVATIPAVLFSRGVTARGHTTMPEFKGEDAAGEHDDSPR